MGDCPLEELFLVAKAGVEAGAVDTHCRGQVIQGRSCVTFLPEDTHGGVKCLVFLERAGTAHLRTGFLIWSELLRSNRVWSHTYLMHFYTIQFKKGESRSGIGTSELCGPKMAGQEKSHGGKAARKNR